jgi:hypothetical protein
MIAQLHPDARLVRFVFANDEERMSADPELERLLRIERQARLRLERLTSPTGVADRQVHEAARIMWEEAKAAIERYFLPSPRNGGESS